MAKGRASHVEGAYGKALQDGTHVEGYGCQATGYWSHAEGEMTVVSSYASHASSSVYPSFYYLYPHLSYLQGVLSLPQQTP